ncbi:hypothetical protein A2714_04160 [Candidatus Woesebacteria bacterium RIFCSPHIGHO2_01_FULL_38_9]|uniref:Uncharacterized protein n=1 Tax=Candidatus Woesebacteria bacterium RIFCSPHIGHO2_01_FULL_38_9 TaxID=1802492 RepID=A0A1F7Y5I2_9BACT|nr:MAG: hypothetical protein A2714_04160 [Candidatus Woesebacteria bacterium RIFCSPHIGHO2_01_FULL_38_9]
MAYLSPFAKNLGRSPCRSLRRSAGKPVDASEEVSLRPCVAGGYAGGARDFVPDEATGRRYPERPSASSGW